MQRLATNYRSSSELIIWLRPPQNLVNYIALAGKSIDVVKDAGNGQD